MIKSIPARPNLEFDRKEAKTLLDEVKSGQPEAWERFLAIILAAFRRSPDWRTRCWWLRGNTASEAGRNGWRSSTRETWTGANRPKSLRGRSARTTSRGRGCCCARTPDLRARIFTSHAPAGRWRR